MIGLVRFAAVFIAVLGLIAVNGPAAAQPKDQDRKGGMEKKAKQHKHHNGKDLLGVNAKKDGEHKLHVSGKHTAFVKVSKGKITGVRVNHADKGDVPVKKYKSTKKMVETTTDGMQRVSLMLAQSQYLGETWIGYAYIDDYGDEVIYWFPYDMVYDADTGAIEYIPIT